MSSSSQSKNNNARQHQRQQGNSPPTATAQSGSHDREKKKPQSTSSTKGNLPSASSTTTPNSNNNNNNNNTSSQLFSSSQSRNNNHNHNHNPNRLSRDELHGPPSATAASGKQQLEGSTSSSAPASTTSHHSPTSVQAPAASMSYAAAAAAKKKQQQKQQSNVPFSQQKTTAELLIQQQSKPSTAHYDPTHVLGGTASCSPEPAHQHRPLPAAAAAGLEEEESVLSSISTFRGVQQFLHQKVTEQNLIGEALHACVELVVLAAANEEQSFFRARAAEKEEGEGADRADAAAAAEGTTKGIDEKKKDEEEAKQQEQSKKAHFSKCQFSQHALREESGRWALSMGFTQSEKPPSPLHQHLSQSISNTATTITALQQQQQQAGTSCTSTSATTGTPSARASKQSFGKLCLEQLETSVVRLQGYATKKATTTTTTVSAHRDKQTSDSNNNNNSSPTHRKELSTERRRVLALLRAVLWSLAGQDRWDGTAWTVPSSVSASSTSSTSSVELQTWREWLSKTSRRHARTLASIVQSLLHCTVALSTHGMEETRTNRTSDFEDNDDERDGARTKGVLENNNNDNAAETRSSSVSHTTKQREYLVAAEIRMLSLSLVFACAQYHSEHIPSTLAWSLLFPIGLDVMRSPFVRIEQPVASLGGGCGGGCSEKATTAATPTTTAQWALLSQTLLHPILTPLLHDPMLFCRVAAITGLQHILVKCHAHFQLAAEGQGLNLHPSFASGAYAALLADPSVSGWSTPSSVGNGTTADNMGSSSMMMNSPVSSRPGSMMLLGGGGASGGLNSAAQGSSSLSARLAAVLLNIHEAILVALVQQPTLHLRSPPPSTSHDYHNDLVTVRGALCSAALHVTAQCLVTAPYLKCPLSARVARGFFRVTWLPAVLNRGDRSLSFSSSPNALGRGTSGAKNLFAQRNVLQRNSVGGKPSNLKDAPSQVHVGEDLFWTMLSGGVDADATTTTSSSSSSASAGIFQALCLLLTNAAKHKAFSHSMLEPLLLQDLDGKTLLAALVQSALPSVGAWRVLAQFSKTIPTVVSLVWPAVFEHAIATVEAAAAWQQHAFFPEAAMNRGALFRSPHAQPSSAATATTTTTTATTTATSGAYESLSDCIRCVMHYVGLAWESFDIVAGVATEEQQQQQPVEQQQQPQQPGKASAQEAIEVLQRVLVPALFRVAISVRPRRTAASAAKPTSSTQGKSRSDPPAPPPAQEGADDDAIREKGVPSSMFDFQLQIPFAPLETNHNSNNNSSSSSSAAAALVVAHRVIGSSILVTVLKSLAQIGEDAMLALPADDRRKLFHTLLWILRSPTPPITTTTTGLHAAELQHAVSNSAKKSISPSETTTTTVAMDSRTSPATLWNGIQQEALTTCAVWVHLFPLCFWEQHPDCTIAAATCLFERGSILSSIPQLPYSTTTSSSLVERLTEAALTVQFASKCGFVLSNVTAGFEVASTDWAAVLDHTPRGGGGGGGPGAVHVKRQQALLQLQQQQQTKAASTTTSSSSSHPSSAVGGRFAASKGPAQPKAEEAAPTVAGLSSRSLSQDDTDQIATLCDAAAFAVDVARPILARAVVAFPDTAASARVAAQLNKESSSTTNNNVVIPGWSSAGTSTTTAVGGGGGVSATVQGRECQMFQAAIALCAQGYRMMSFLLASLDDNQLLMEVTNHPEGVATCFLELCQAGLLNTSQGREVKLRWNAAHTLGIALARQEVVEADPHVSRQCVDALFTALQNDSIFKVRSTAAIALAKLAIAKRRRASSLIPTGSRAASSVYLWSDAAPRVLTAITEAMVAASQDSQVSFHQFKELGAYKEALGRALRGVIQKGPGTGEFQEALQRCRPRLQAEGVSLLE